VDERLRTTIRLLACCLLLAALAFVTRPGNIIADTKLDLAINPAGFLSRALHLWDSQQFGQLQDQAFGYFFPMGPFFVLGKLMALPAWVIQRFWLAAVLITAFLGIVRLTARLGIGTPWTQIAAGLAYAMAPRGLGLLGQLSSEFLPAAMLPWILLPLVTAARGGSRMRSAARSATAVALCGGINAAATIAVLVPAAAYLLTARRPAPRWRIFAWWVPAVVLATLWWTVPLLLLDKYGFSALPYTESAGLTTSVTSLANTLRGTEDWVNYLVVNGQPWFPVGYKISTEALPILLTGLAAGLGLTGLVRGRLPERRFLLCVLLAGILIIATGYVSGLGNPVAASLHHLINGPLAPLRNLRKFDPMIRLPLVLGLAHLLGSMPFPRLRTAAGAVAAVAIGGVALPAFVNGLSGTGDFPQVPQYWVSAADWLNSHAGQQGVLVVPGARFGEYTWGRPLDDVMEPLSTVTWGDRQLTNIGSAGYARLLDAVDQRLAAGEGSAGLTQVLASMGVKYVVVRNDLSRPDLRGAWPARVQDALDTSPGLSEVAQFGQQSPAGATSPNDAVSNFDPPYPPVQIYQVQGAQPVASVVSASSALRVFGAPEALLTLGDEGLLGNRPVLLDGDAAGLPAAQSVATDSLRRRVRDFGEIRTEYSPTLTVADPASTYEATGDYLDPGWTRYLSVAQYLGVKDVTASSSSADIGALTGEWGTGLLPYAAVDGDARTEWESGSSTGPLGQWLQIDFDDVVNPGAIEATIATNPTVGPAVTRVDVQTAAGRVTDAVQAVSGPQSLRVPAGPSRWLRITVTGLASPSPGYGTQVAISEISVPGVKASRTIRVPEVPVPGGDPTAVVMSKTQAQPSGCMLTPLRWVCSPVLARPTEEQYGFDHTFTERATRLGQLYGTAVLTDPSLIQKYAQFGPHQPRVTASSTDTADPEDLARSAFDGNPATAWIASPSDARPSLSIRWDGSRTVSQLTIGRPPGASSLLQVLVTGSGGQVRGGIVAASGRLSFQPMRTSQLTLQFSPSQTPLQITDVDIPGVPRLNTPSSSPFRLPCGFGPRILLNGTAVRTRVSGTFADLLTGQPMEFTACSQVAVAAGDNRVVEPALDAFDLESAVVDAAGSQALAAAGAGAGAGAGAAAAADADAAPGAGAGVRQWTSSLRVLRVTASRSSYLVVDENFNTGWQATIGRKVLRPVRLDGWKQAWLLPAGTDGLVTLTYTADSLYRGALLGGFCALGLVAGAAAVPLRRRLAAPLPPRRSRGRRSRVPQSVTAPQAAGAAAASSLAGFWLGGYPGAILLPGCMVAFAVAVPRGICLGGHSPARGHPGPRWPNTPRGICLGGRRFAPPNTPRRYASRLCLELTRPWVVAALLAAASGCAAAGERLLQAGGSPTVADLLLDTIPQVVCLVIAGRLLVALLLPDLVGPPDLADGRPDAGLATVTRPAGGLNGGPAQADLPSADTPAAAASRPAHVPAGEDPGDPPRAGRHAAGQPAEQEQDRAGGSPVTPGRPPWPPAERPQAPEDTAGPARRARHAAGGAGGREASSPQAGAAGGAGGRQASSPQAGAAGPPQ